MEIVFTNIDTLYINNDITEYSHHAYVYDHGHGLIDLSASKPEYIVAYRMELTNKTQYIQLASTANKVLHYKYSGLRYPYGHK
jgi:hypothetical protein